MPDANAPPGSARKIPVNGLPLADLKIEMERIGWKPYRAEQIFRWLYKKDAGSFEEMTNIQRGVRPELDLRYAIGRAKLAGRQDSRDGTTKLLLEFPDGAKVETVLIPETRRLTVCISTQVGCPLGCAFCRTGTMKRERDLLAWEIVEQVMAAGRFCPGRAITNVVFMGMGEPLLNYDNTLAAVRILTDDLGPNFSNRRVTISTAGIVPAIRRLGRDTDASLAISLHATTDEVRSKLMPIGKKYPLAELLKACKEYPLSNRRRITYEYIMLEGINDSPEDAKRLRRLMAPLKAHVNLIAFNPWEGCPYRPTPEPKIREFQKVLLDAKINTVIRRSRGQDILAACGQLKSCFR